MNLILAWIIVVGIGLPLFLWICYLFGDEESYSGRQTYHPTKSDFLNKVIDGFMTLLFIFGISFCIVGVACILIMALITIIS